MAVSQAEFAVGSWIEQDLRQPVKVTAHISKPVQLTCWSKAGGEYFYGSNTGLGAYQRPQELPIDLNMKMNTFIKKDDSEATPVECILDAVIQGDGEQGLSLNSAHICTFRNNLNKIFLTPFAPDKAWVLDACLMNASGSQLLCLDIVKLDEKPYPGMDKFIYYGYHFEAVCTNASYPVDATSEYSSVLQLKLGKLRVLMAAEIDACMDMEGRDASPVDTFVELKTVMKPNNQGAQQRMAREKFPRFWVQSFLAGVPKIMVGERSRDGLLLEVKPLDVQQIPAIAASMDAPFNAHQLLRFGVAVLEWMHAYCCQHVAEHVSFAYEPEHKRISAQVREGGALPQRLEPYFPCKDVS